MESAMDGDISNLSALGASTILTVVSEIGDKTFLIAMIMASKYNRLAILFSCYWALVLMTTMTYYGALLVPLLLDEHMEFIKILTGALFIILGAFSVLNCSYKYYKMTKRADDEAGEIAERTREVAELVGKWDSSEDGIECVATQSESNIKDISNIVKTEEKRRHSLGNAREMTLDVNEGAQVSSEVFESGKRNWTWKPYVSAFALTFVAELGDKSQISGVGITAAYKTIYVYFGMLLGHLLCTLIAVATGKLIMKYISILAVEFIGGALFLCFGILTILFA